MKSPTSFIIKAIKILRYFYQIDKKKKEKKKEMPKM